MSEQSESIKELATALAKAQGKITGALKDSKNPFFKSNYADLASCWDACRDVLSANGLSVAQTLDREGYLVTTLMHSSGEWIKGAVKMSPTAETPQAIGSCITYMRRYSLAAIVGIAQIDDDANAASGKDNRDDSGKPDGWRAADTRKVTEYQKLILDAVAEGADLKAVDIWMEVKDDHTFATALWVVLPSPIKKMIRENMPKGETNAAA